MQEARYFIQHRGLFHYFWAFNGRCDASVKGFLVEDITMARNHTVT